MAHVEFVRPIICLLVLIVSFFPIEICSSCCRLPFTDGLCRVNREGPHRYQIMPDRKSGIVNESTECFINDFDASFRLISNGENVCNDCPGLLILHTNSSEIFLFPEYLERILEHRPFIQRKNVVILTSGLTGAYDLDFSLLARFYQSTPVDKIPSIYVDLELPSYDPRKNLQPSLRLRLPTDVENEDLSFRINREDLVSAFDLNGQPTPGLFALPFIYHFDAEKHLTKSIRCQMYEIRLTPLKLDWTRLDSEGSACYTFMPFFGRNPCFSTGFTRLFCPIHESIDKDDRLILSPYVRTNDRVERLTLAAMGDSQVTMALSNEQYKPAEQVKILLLQGSLVVTDINTNLMIRVEYGWDCDKFNLTVPSGFSATRYRRFDGEIFSVHDKDVLISLPQCFRLSPNFEQSIVTENEISDLLNNSFSHSNENNQTENDDSWPESNQFEDQSNSISVWNFLFRKDRLIYTIPCSCCFLLILILLIGLSYRFCCDEKHHAVWTLKNQQKISESSSDGSETRVDLNNPASTESATQTNDQTVRI